MGLSSITRFEQATKHRRQGNRYYLEEVREASLRKEFGALKDEHEPSRERFSENK